VGRRERLRDLLELVERRGLDPESPGFAAWVYRYLKIRYGFTDQTIRDYIKTVRMLLRAQRVTASP